MSTNTQEESPNCKQNTWNKIYLLLIIFGWSTLIGTLALGFSNSYQSYIETNEIDYVFYKVKTNGKTSYGYVIKIGSNLTINNETNATELTQCSIVSENLFKRITYFVKNYAIIISYFIANIVLFISEITSTYVRVQKIRGTYRLNLKQPKTADKFSWVLFFLKTNFICGTFVVSIIDYSLPCIRLNIAEFFVDAAYYSMIILFTTVGIYIFYLTFFCTFVCNIACTNVREDLEEKFKKFKNFFQIVTVIVFIIVILFEITNLVFWIILFLGPKIAVLVNSLYAVNTIADVGNHFI